MPILSIRIRKAYRWISSTFLYRRLGFGNFIFKGQDGKPLAEAHNLDKFQKLFKEIPAEALLYHGSRNSFSTWLMARGEINMADKLRPVKTKDFQSAEEMTSNFV
jgi:hypothetical protein